MGRCSGIGARLVLWTMLCVTLILGMSLGRYHHQARELLWQRLQEDAQNRALTLVQRTERALGAVRRTAEALALTLESGWIEQDHWPELMRQVLAESPELFALSLGFAPESLGHPDRRYLPYVFRRAGEIAVDFVVDAQEEDYPFEDWYQLPRELNRPEWSEPYYDDYAGETRLIATFSLPVEQATPEGPRLLGVLAADIALDWLTRELAEFHVLEHGFAVLISRNGAILSHPDPDLVMNETLFSLAAARGEGTPPSPSGKGAGGEGALRAQARALISGEAGFIPSTDLFGVKAHVYHAPIRASNWTIAIVFPEEELFDDLDRLTLEAATVGGIGLLVALPIVLLIGRSISRPLRALAQATERIAQGALDAPLPALDRGDEVGLLTGSFAAMQSALRQHIEQLKAATAAKERIESELRIARDIQMSILPRPLPPDDQRTFGLCATLVPAREVSGDFYDFFMLDPDRLCFVIADVSGKGMPSALFAVAAKTLIKARARDRLDPAAILTEVNAELAADNPSNMFVTVFCGILDTRSGELIYTNAGHNPPLVLGADGKAHWLKSQPQLLLGVMEGMCYRSDRLSLLPGERLLLYTDGITEAKDGQDTFFGEARLLAALESASGQGPEGLIASVREQVGAFVGAAPQADDMTLLAIEYLGSMASVYPEIGWGEASSPH